MSSNWFNNFMFFSGDRVYVIPLKEEATVIRQILHHDMGETFWGNVELVYDGGEKAISNSWQLRKL